MRQVILSTDGVTSFASFILNDGEGLRALESENIYSFNAGDQVRSFIYQPTMTSLRTLYEGPHSFRIDGT